MSRQLSLARITWFAMIAFVPMILFLSASESQATTYNFSSSKPSCTGTWSASGNTHTCSGSVSLASGDQITPSSSITVKATSGISFAGNNAIGTVTANVTLENNYGGIEILGGSVVYGSITNTSGQLSLSGTTVSGSITASSGGITLTGGSVQGLVSSNCCAITTKNTNLSGGASSPSGTMTIDGGEISGNFSSAGGSGIIISNATMTSGTITGSGVGVSVKNSTLGSGAQPIAIAGNGISIEKVTMPNGTLSTASTQITVDDSDLGTATSTVNITTGNQVVIKNTSIVYGNVTAGGWSSALDIQDTSVVYGTCSPTHPKCSLAISVDVVSIARNQPELSLTGSTVSWTITFSTAVTGVDAADFQLLPDMGVSGHAIVSVTGSGSTWQLTANTGNTTGTLGLNLVDDDTIRSGSTRLGGVGNGNGNFTGEVYIVALACATGPIISGTPKMEVGALTLIDTYQKPTPTVVNFTQSFTAPPLVFTLPTNDGDNAAAHRIRNVTKSGFEIMTLEPQGEDGEHVAMAVNFLAIDPGRYILPDGHKIEACAFPITKAQQSLGSKDWEFLAFQSGFTTSPVILGQVQTMNNETGKIPTEPSQPWLTTSVSNALPDRMQIALERSETIAGSINTAETMAYFAAEPTNGRKSFVAGSNTIEYEIIRSAEVVKGWNSCTLIAYSSQWLRGKTPFSPIPLATPNTRRGDSGNGGEDDGGWFRRCTENVTNESNRVALKIDEVRQGTTNYDKNRTHNTPERAGIVVFSDNFVTTPVKLHHIEIQHPTSGLTCAPSSITLKACSDASCNTLYTGSVTLDLTPNSTQSNWLGSGVQANQVVFIDGSVTVQLAHTANSTVTLGASGTPNAPNPLVCKRDDGSISNCQMSFSSSGAQLNFIPPTGDRICNRAENWTLEAKSCGGANWNNKTKKIRLWFNYDTPASGTDKLALNGTDLPTSDPGTGNGFNLSFNGSGLATLSNLRYTPAVGKLKISAAYTGSAATGDAGESRSGETVTTFRPFAIWITADSGTCTTTPSSSCNPYKAAGDSFSLRAKAVCWDASDDTDSNGVGDPGANLSNNTLAKGFLATDLELQVENGEAAPFRNAKLVDVGGALLTPVNFNMASNDGPINDLRIDEVGVFRFTASGPYLGTTIPALVGSGTLIGRFYPAQFKTEITAPGCTDFTYSGQRFKFSASALNRFNQITQNYEGGWAKNISLTEANAASGTFAPTSLSASTFVAGIIAPAADVSFTFSNPLTAPLTLKVRAKDTDGASSETGIEGTTPIRSGRLRLSNAFGTVKMPPPMHVRTQYWSGNSWITHNDQCTKPATSDLNITPSLATPALNPNNAVGPWTIRFTNANDGSADVCANLGAMAWLRNPGDPCAKVTFGVYPAESKKTVHTRELY